MESESTLEKVQKQDRERGALLQSLKQEKASLQVGDPVDISAVVGVAITLSWKPPQYSNWVFNKLN